MPTKRTEKMLEKLGTSHRSQTHVSNLWFNEHSLNDQHLQVTPSPRDLEAKLFSGNPCSFKIHLMTF